jgi:hypothetical protein
MNARRLSVVKGPHSLTAPDGRREFTGLGILTQPPVLEWDALLGWVLWLHYNREKTAGTYLNLLQDGAIVRYTVQPTGEVSETTTIKPPV